RGPRAMATVRWWMGLPTYAEPPLEFAGVSGGLPRSMPFLSSEFVPFARLGLIRSIGEGLGGDAPDDVALWPAPVEASPVACLRWFFDGLARDSHVIDFGVASIDVGEPKDGVVESTVLVRRYGGARFPTTIRVGFEDGAVRTFTWGLDDRVVAADEGKPPETV